VAVDATSGTTDETPADPARHSPHAAPGMVDAFLYDADGDDRPVAFSASIKRQLVAQDLLWVDFNMTDRDALARLDSCFGTAMTSFAGDAPPRPALRDYGECFVLRVLPLPMRNDRLQAETLTCAVGMNWLATVHDGDVLALEEFANHLRGDSALGRLDAPSFLARLLEWVVNAYFDELDRLQRIVDKVEVAILRKSDEESVIERLVTLRHEVGRLRRRLSPHRQVFSTLSHPSFDVLSSSSAAAEFEILDARLEVAIEAVDTTREMIVGAFDVFMTQTAQHTNDIIRTLTIVSLMLLPASLIAGLFGMNMVPTALMQPVVFWLAIIGMVVVAGALLLIMRMRHWL
jgi:magnesium transporter